MSGDGRGGGYAPPPFPPLGAGQIRPPGFAGALPPGVAGGPPSPGIPGMPPPIPPFGGPRAPFPMPGGGMPMPFPPGMRPPATNGPMSGGPRPLMPPPGPPPPGGVPPLVPLSAPGAGASPSFQPPQMAGPPRGPALPPQMTAAPVGPPPGIAAPGMSGPFGQQPGNLPPGPAPPTTAMQRMQLGQPPPTLSPAMPNNAPLRGAGVPQPMAPPTAGIATAPPMGLQSAMQPPPLQQIPPPPTGDFQQNLAPPSFGLPPGPPGASQFAAPKPGGILPPGAPTPSSAAKPSTPSTNRIDPSQIPRPAAYEKEAHAEIVHETMISGAHNQPPPSTSSFVVRDTGNCTPRCMRVSLNQCPCSTDNLATSSMPFCMMVQPLALPDPRDDPIQVVDFGEGGPVRCSACKAYMNPFMRWVEGGRRFQCNFCEAMNECPAHYFAHTGPDGRRSDANERPELCKGSVEIVATKDYMVRPPMVITHFFAIDVSAYAIESGATASACSAVASVLDSFQGNGKARVGIVTFNQHVNFFSFGSSSKQPYMIVVPDVNEPYCPAPSNMVVNVAEHKEELLQLLESIPDMYTAPSAENAGGAALFSCLEALQASGGKITMFMAAMPNSGALVLKQRPASKTGDKEIMKAMECNDPAWQVLGRRCADFQICVDMFLLTKNYIDIATMSVVANITGGSVYHYDQFTPELDQGQLENDLRWNLLRPQGMEAVMRLRCSQGLAVENYTGAMYQRTQTDIDLAGIDSDKAIMVTIKHEDKLPDTKLAYFQAALLYTNTNAERRIRIHTLAVPCTNVLGTMYRGADLDTQFFYLARRSADSLAGSSLGQVRETVTTTAVNILYAYRKYCATSTSSGQLILPEALKLLPLYALALTKSGALRSDTSLDSRSVWLQRLRTFGPTALVPLIYPRLYNVLEARQGSELVPPALSLSSEKLDPQAIFLLENGVEAYMYIGKQVSPETLQALLGVSHLEEAGVGPSSKPLNLQRLETSLSRTVNALMDEIRQYRCTFMRLRIIKRSDPLEPVFFNLLLEDRSVTGMSYVEYLCHIHRQIQNKFA